MQIRDSNTFEILGRSLQGQLDGIVAMYANVQRVILSLGKIVA